MKKVRTSGSTEATIPSTTDTWQATSRDPRQPVAISAARLEKERLLAEALDQYCTLRAKGQSPSPSQFCERYPDYRHTLRKLIDVEDIMADQPELEDERWPEKLQLFLGYQILHELGIGTFARVYLAAETALGGRLVAVKVSREGGEEAETLAKLNHPNVVPVYSVQQDEESEMTAVCMPYHGSTTLEDVLALGFLHAGGPPTSASVILDVAREREQVVDFAKKTLEENPVHPILRRGSYADGVAWLGIQMAEALAYTHQNGILHRDLKPSNVLVTPAGVPKLLDFNLACDIGIGARRFGGTLTYMPPEQIRDAHLHPAEADLSGDPRSDIFSLGVILYQALTGKLPFGDAPEYASPREAAAEYTLAQQRPPIPIVKLNPQVSPVLARTVTRCLSLEIESRPQSAVQLAKELRRHFGWPAKIKQYRPLVLASVAVLLLAITGAIRSATSRTPDHVRHMNLAITALEAEDYDQAIQHFNRAEDAEGNATVPILFGRGYCYAQKEMLPIALSELKRASELAQDPLVSDCYAQFAMISGDFVSAIISYQESNVRNKDCAMRYVSLAYCKLKHRPNKPELVIGDLSKALELDPELQIAYHLRANANRDASRPEFHPIERSISDIESAFRVSSAPAQLHLDAARVYAVAAIKNPDFLVNMKIHLTAAVEVGLSRTYLEGIEEFEHWRNSDWFLPILSKCRESKLARSHGSLRSLSLLNRTSGEVVARLRQQSPR